MIKKLTLLVIFTSFFSTAAFAESDAFKLLSKAADLAKSEKLKKLDKDKLTEGINKHSSEKRESDLLSSYSGSTLTATYANDYSKLTLPLSSNLDSDNKNYAKLSLTGAQEVFIYDVPQEVTRSYLKVFNTLKQQAANSGFETLYECDSGNKNCGYFFPRQILADRSKDAANIYDSNFSDITNFHQTSNDMALYTGKAIIRGKTYFLFIIVGSDRKLQYSIETVQAEDPRPKNSTVANTSVNTTTAIPTTTNVTAGHNPEDHELISRFAGSKLTAVYENDYSKLSLPLSANLNSDQNNYKKLNLLGDQKTYIYDVPLDLTKSYLKVFATMTRQFSELGFETLFSCTSDDKNCGYFFPRHFIFNDRSKDAASVYQKNFYDLTNFEQSTTDMAIYVGKINIKGHTNYLLMITGKPGSTRNIQYSIEIIKAE